jgi:hypothetical protein
MVIRAQTMGYTGRRIAIRVDAVSGEEGGIES